MPSPEIASVDPRAAEFPDAVLAMPGFRYDDHDVPAVQRSITSHQVVALLGKIDDNALCLSAKNFLLAGDIQGFNDLRATNRGWDPDLSNTHFDAADLAGANFHGVNLEKSTFRSAVLFGVDFSFANLHDAVFDLASFDHEANLYQADLTGASLWNVQGLTSEQLAKVKSLQSVAVTEEFYTNVLQPAFAEFVERLRATLRVGSGL